MNARVPQRARGFTATEVMVVLVILGVLGAFAAPSMKRLLTTQKVRSASYDLNADLTFARGQAISRGHQIAVKSISGGTDWIGGWEVWDLTASPNVMLRQQNALAAGVNFTADAQSLTYERSGRATPTPATATGIVTFAIVPQDTSLPNEMKRCVRIDPSGRPTTQIGACA